MKFLIALVAFFVCASAQTARTKCTYFSDNLMLTCKSPGGDVSCETLANFPLNFKIVGLGFDQTSSSPDTVRLFGFQVGQPSWTFHTVNGVEMSLSTTAVNGFRVRHQECMDKLMILFRASTGTLTVPVNKSGARDQAALFGEVFLFERQLNQRTF